MSGAHRLVGGAPSWSVTHVGVLWNTVPTSFQLVRFVDSRIWMFPLFTPPWGSPVENRYQVVPCLVMLGSWTKTYPGRGTVRPLALLGAAVALGPRPSQAHPGPRRGRQLAPRQWSGLARGRTAQCGQLGQWSCCERSFFPCSPWRPQPARLMPPWRSRRPLPDHQAALLKPLR